MKMHRRALAASAVIAFAAVAAGCGSTSDAPEDSAEKTDITVGFNPGPYRELFERGVQPLLEDNGYDVEVTELTDGIVTNVALSDGELDASIMQHTVFQDAINEQEGLSNVALVEVPTPPMALFGGQSDSLDPAEGATVGVPNQPSNMYRALVLLADLGWLELSDDIDTATASPADIEKNVAGIEIVQMENAQQVASLQDVDYSVIQGNFVVSGGLDLTDALALEDLSDEFAVIVSVDEASVDAPWADDLKAAFESDEFAAYVAENSQYDGYRLPDALTD